MSEEVETAISVKWGPGMVVLSEVALLSPHRPDGASLYSNVTHFPAPCGNTRPELVTSGRSVAEENPGKKYFAGIAIIRSNDSITLA
jgi:hypothetical protein